MTFQRRLLWAGTYFLDVGLFTALWRLSIHGLTQWHASVSTAFSAGPCMRLFQAK